ncbi:MAG: Lactonase, 7-bladed beta-propeller, partial [Bacteroidota bacterium]
AENKNEFTAVEEQIISLPAGSGPRHICFDKNYAYGFIINELNGSITIIKHSAEKKEYKIKGNFDLSGQLSGSLNESVNTSTSIDTDLGAAAIVYLHLTAFLKALTILLLIQREVQRPEILLLTQLENGY